MNANIATTLCRNWAREAQDRNYYTDVDIQQAIHSLCSRFCRETRYARNTGQVVLTGSDSVSLSGLPNFQGQQTIAAWVSGYHYQSGEGRTLLRVNPQQLFMVQQQEPGLVDPKYLAFTSPLACQLYANPANGTLNLSYWQNFGPVWAWGVDNPDLILADNVLMEILPMGVPALLQFHDPGHAYAQGAMQRYLAIEARYKVQDADGNNMMPMRRRCSGSSGPGSSGIGSYYGRR